MKLVHEFYAHHKQLNASGDDMNQIQVGRPAVSRFHQNRRIYKTDCSPDYPTHDFAQPQYNLKLGGFMLTRVQPLNFEIDSASEDSALSMSSTSSLPSPPPKRRKRQGAELVVTSEEDGEVKQDK